MFSLQIQYIHQLVQSRLFAEESPLVDLYKCLRILYFVFVTFPTLYKAKFEGYLKERLHLLRTIVSFCFSLPNFLSLIMKLNKI